MINENYLDYIKKYLGNPTASNLNSCVEALLNSGFELEITLQKNICNGVLKKDGKYLFVTSGEDLKYIYISIINYLYEINYKHTDLIVIIFNTNELKQFINKIQILNEDMFRYYLEGTRSFPLLIWDIGLEHCQHQELPSITNEETWKKTIELIKKAKTINELEEN